MCTDTQAGKVNGVMKTTQSVTIKKEEQTGINLAKGSELVMDTG